MTAPAGRLTTGPRGGRLFYALAGPALAWVLHLLASYAIVALACAGRGPGPRLVLGGVTLACLAIAATAGLTADRVRRASTEATLRWLLAAAAAMGVLFAILIVLGGLVPLLAPLCAPA